MRKVAQRDGSRGVGADEIPLDGPVDWTGLASGGELNASDPGIDNIVGARRAAANNAAGAHLDVDAEIARAEQGCSRGINAQVITLQDSAAAVVQNQTPPAAGCDQTETPNGGTIA